MDGYKIRAKLALNFPRPVGNAEAEEVMMQYARAFATAVECELSNGDLPFEEHELHQRITDAVQALPKKNVRLIGLHVWHKGAVSSRSMMAVKPEGKATVPAMSAVSVSQTREKTASQPASHTATTVKPEARGSSGSPGSYQPVEAPPSVRGTVTVPAPSQVQQNPEVASARAPAPAARPPAQPAPPPASRITTTSMPAAGSRSAVTTTSMPAATPAATSRSNVTTTSMPAATTRSAVTTTSMPAVTRSAPSTTSMPAMGRMISGVVPAVEPRILRTKSGFLVALEQTSAETGDDVGQAMAQPIRDAAAGVLLAMLDALHGAITDPLALFDGRAPAELRRSLIGESCVCVCYVLYESLTRTSLPQMVAIQVVQSACVHALSDKNMPVSEISRYLATESPREELTARACALLGTRETPELQQRIDTALRSLRIDVKACADQIESRLSRAKAAGGR
jgi:hypothetical protein